jgi:glycerophosphoryl diester phosphodiesterase
VRPVLAVLAELDAWDRVCLAGYHDPWLRVARRLARAHGAPLFTSMGHTAVVGLRMRGWTRRETARPGGRRRPPRVRTGRLASVRGDLAQLPHRFAGVTVVDADVLRVSHESGREVHVWTVDDPAVMGGLLDGGADGILTDRPDLLRDLLRTRGTWP